MRNSQSRVLPLFVVTGALLFGLSCVTASAPSPAFVIARGCVVTPDQLRSLQRSLAADTPADWIEIKERDLQQVKKGRRPTYLWAEAVRTPRVVAAHLCEGELTPFQMRDEDFDSNTWRPFPSERYATYGAAASDPCRQARELDHRFWVRGEISSDELAAVLRVFTQPAAVAGTLVTLLPDERIILITKKPIRSDERIVEIRTSRGRDHGRVIEFENRAGVWTGRVLGEWVS
jgi:hypothetical protein